MTPAHPSVPLLVLADELPSPPEVRARPSAAEPATPPAAGDAYEPARGISREEKEVLAALEDQAAAKTASDYQHIIWAYGVLWALFAAYGLFLWRKSARLRADVDALRRSLANPGGPRA